MTGSLFCFMSVYNFFVRQFEAENQVSNALLDR